MVHCISKPLLMTSVSAYAQGVRAVYVCHGSTGGVAWQYPGSGAHRGMVLQKVWQFVIRCFVLWKLLCRARQG